MAPADVNGLAVSTRLAHGWLRTLLAVALVLAACVPFAWFLGSAFARVRYPFELEWMEGGIMTHIQIAREGGQLYRAPSVEFTPFIYPPLYYYVSAVVSWGTGLGYLAPRLVSIASVLGVFFTIARWVKDDTDDLLAGVVAASAFAATYALSEYWFDVARVDCLYLLLILSGLRVARRASSVTQAALAGLLLVLACYTKQSGLPIAALGLVWVGVESVRRGVVAVGVFVGLGGAVFLVWNALSHGWFNYYLFELPRRHEIAWDTAGARIKELLWLPAAPMTLAALASCAGVGFKAGERRKWLHHASLSLVAVTMSFTSLIKTGGYPNALFPAYAVVAISFGLQIAALRRVAHGPAFGALGPRVLALVLVALQLGLLQYDTGSSPPNMSTLARSTVPTTADREAGQAFLRRLERLPKPAFVTTSSFYTTLAGQHGTVTHTMGLVDVFKGGGKQAGFAAEALRAALRERRFKTIILDRAAGFLTSDFVDLIHKNYRSRGTIIPGQPGTAFWPRSGAWVRPDEIWVAKD